MRRDWHDRLSRVSDFRFADQVHASYRFRRKFYRDEVDAGFDAKSQIFWMRRERRTKPSSLYEAVAKQLVFTSTARPIDLLALERTLEFEVNDPSFGRPTGTETDAIDDTITEKDDGRIEHTDGADSEPGEAVLGHSPFDPDASRNVPKPSPIPRNSARVSRRPSQPSGSARQGEYEGDSQPPPALEPEHIQALKGDHYASHCQICLCLRSPKELAPDGSYVQWEEVRRRIVEAHHVDPKSGGGARHAGNLVLLCKVHHDNYGRRLSRAAVTAALRNNSKELYIDFGMHSRVQGKYIELTIPDSRDVVQLFFHGSSRHLLALAGMRSKIGRADVLGLEFGRFRGVARIKVSPACNSIVDVERKIYNLDITHGWKNYSSMFIFHSARTNDFS